MATGTIGFRTAAAVAYTKGGASAVYCVIHPAVNTLASIKEITVQNTTTTACSVALVRVSSFGTVSSSEAFQSDNAALNNTLQTVLDETWSGNPTTSNTPINRRFTIPAAAGGGVTFQFNDEEYVCSSNGSWALVNATGTGQILDVIIRIRE